MLILENISFTQVLSFNVSLYSEKTLVKNIKQRLVYVLYFFVLSPINLKKELEILLYAFS